MKRALSILGVIGVTALITYLAVTRQQAQEQAARLDQALRDAEARVSQLEEDINAAKQRLTQLTEARQATRSLTPPPRKAPAIAPSAPAAATFLPDGVPAIASPPASGGAAITVAPLPVVGPLVRYAAFSGPGLATVVRIEGTSKIRDWQVESHLIGGTAEFGAGLPMGSGVQALPDTVEAKVNVFIMVRSLKSVDKEGRPYSDTMDNAMYGKLLADTNPRITYTLNSLTLKEQPREVTDPFLYEATGNLTVAGVTNAITMPVAVSPQPAGRIQLAGSVKVKMSDFKITPLVRDASLGGIRIGDEVTLKFVWWVRPANTSQAAK